VEDRLGRHAINKAQRKQVEQFRAMIEPFCRQPIIGLCYLFARGSILDWALHGLAGGIATPVPGVPDVITDKIKDVVTDQVREGHQERSGGRSQALCAITESQVVVVGVAPAAAAFGLAPTTTGSPSAPLRSSSTGPPPASRFPNGSSPAV
jgi:hypothetical protein